MARITASNPDDDTMTVLVEDALRHLYDCSYLGHHQLAQLHLLEHLPLPPNGAPGLTTHLDLGHAVHYLLVDIIKRLRPEGVLSTGMQIPPREWYPYIILHNSYVQGEQTGEIMARLYISEGTYYRTRRRALRSIAKAIQELEHQIWS